jgi:hypothetical protein
MTARRGQANGGAAGVAMIPPTEPRCQAMNPRRTRLDFVVRSMVFDSACMIKDVR